VVNSLGCSAVDVGVVGARHEGDAEPRGQLLDGAAPAIVFFICREGLNGGRGGGIGGGGVGVAHVNFV